VKNLYTYVIYVRRLKRGLDSELVAVGSPLFEYVGTTELSVRITEQLENCIIGYE